MTILPCTCRKHGWDPQCPRHGKGKQPTVRRLLISLLLGAVLLFALLTEAPALAITRDSILDEVSSWIAMRPVGVKCYEPEEPNSPDSIGAWGYVKLPLAKARFSHLDALICEGALHVNDAALPRWQRALGVMVLTHEAYHLRHWGAAGDEAKVECKTIRHWRYVARRLAASEETISELWPSALASHYALANYAPWSPWSEERPYYDPTCVVPPLFEIESED